MTTELGTKDFAIIAEWEEDTESGDPGIYSLVLAMPKEENFTKDQAADPVVTFLTAVFIRFNEDPDWAVSQCEWLADKVEALKDKEARDAVEGGSK